MKEPTPLIIAAQEGDRNILKTLLQKNAQIDEQDLSGSMALMVAVKRYLFEDELEETRECVEMLLEWSMELTLMLFIRFYGTVLFIGGYQENYNIVKVALQYKAEIKHIADC